MQIFGSTRLTQVSAVSSLLSDVVCVAVVVVVVVVVVCGSVCAACVVFVVTFKCVVVFVFFLADSTTPGIPYGCCGGDMN